MPIEDTTFEIMRKSALREYRKEQVIHFDMDIEFMAIVPDDVNPATVSELDVRFTPNCPRAFRTTAAANGLPGAFGGILLCVDTSIERYPNKISRYKVECKYSTDYSDDVDRDHEGHDDNDPTTWFTYARIHRNFEKIPIGFARKDEALNPYANSCGEPFEDTPMLEQAITSYRAWQYLAANTSILGIKDRNNVLNDDDWGDFGKHELKTEIVEDEYGYFGTPMFCRRVLIEFKHNPFTWLDYRQDYGFNTLINPAGPKALSNWKLNDNGERGALNGAGAASELPANLSFRWNKEKPFNTLFKVIFAAP